jgi:hypothetical protein
MLGASPRRAGCTGRGEEMSFARYLLHELAWLPFELAVAFILGWPIAQLILWNERRWIKNLGDIHFNLDALGIDDCYDEDEERELIQRVTEPYL